MKLSLRELFLLVALAAMGCGWWTYANRMNARMAGMASELQESERSGKHWKWCSDTMAKQLTFTANCKIEYDENHLTIRGEYGAPAFGTYSPYAKIPHDTAP